MPEATLHMYGIEGMEFMLKGVQRRGSTNIGPGLEKVGEAMLRSERELFETSGASAGHPWEKLDPDTVERKRRSFAQFPEHPLIESGDLMLSLSRRNHSDNIFNITRSSVYIGTRNPVAKFHQDGFDHDTSSGSEHVRARPPIMFGERDESRYAKVLGDWIFHQKLLRATRRA